MADTWRQHFSVNAGDLIALRRWLYGAADAQALMLRCFARRPHSGRISEPIVLDEWQAMDDLCARAAGIDPDAERAERASAFLAGVR